MKNVRFRKNFKNVFLVMILMFMFLMVGQSVYAEGILETDGNGVLTTKKYTNTNKLNKALTFDDLKASAWIFCSERGQHIPSYRNTQYYYNADNADRKGYDDTLTDQNEKYAEADGKEAEGEGKFDPGVYPIENTTDAEGFTGTLEIESGAKYTKGAMQIAKPHEAFILTETKNNTGDYYSIVQGDWWHTDAGGKGRADKTPAKGKLITVAEAYEDSFVPQLVVNESDIKNTDTYVKISQGDKEVYFPEIKPDDELVTIDESKAKVQFNEKEQKYIIGPYTMDYPFKEDSEIKFGFIEKMTLKTNKGTPTYEDDWRILNSSLAKQTEYPKPGEEFYIELDYQEGVTSIVHLYVKYKFLIVGGAYTPLEGKYDLTTYTVERTDGEPIKTYDEKGNETGSQATYTYKATKGGGTKKSQTLAWVEYAARFYKTINTDVLLDLGANSKKTYLKIKKVALDENGNEMTADQVKQKFGNYQYFTFNVKIYKDGDENDVRFEDAAYSVRAGSSATISLKVKSGEKLRYVVKENTPSDPWKFVKMENGTGILEPGIKKKEAPTAIAKNQLDNDDDHVAVLEIQKEVEAPENIEDEKTKNDMTEAMKQDREFEFLIKIKRKVDDIEEELAEKTVKVKVPAGQLKSEVVRIDKFDVYTGKINSETGEKEKIVDTEFKWYGNKTPSYEVIEVNKNGYDKVSITNGDGFLNENANEPIKVYVKNTDDSVKTKSSNIRISKELKEGQVSNDKDKEYYFRVNIDKVTDDVKERVNKVYTVKLGSPALVGELIWKDIDDAPTYTIIETDKNGNPVDNSNVESISVNGEVVVTGNNTIHGTLQEEKETNIMNVMFTNIEKPNSGKIKVRKEIQTPAKENGEDAEFTINIVVTGESFYYQGTHYESTGENPDGNILQITTKIKGGHEFVTDEISWFGNTPPTYRIEEELGDPLGWQLVGIDYTKAGDPAPESSGHTLKKDDTVEITILNELPVSKEVDLLFPMGGMVWVERQTGSKDDDAYYGNAANGVYDEGLDELKANVDVNVYKTFYINGEQVARIQATAYQDDKGNSPFTLPTQTNAKGRWDVPKIEIPGLDKRKFNDGIYDAGDEKIKTGCETFEEFIAECTVGYDVEFTYDGQTYEPTEFLSYKVDGDKHEENKGDNAAKAEEFKNSERKTKNLYIKDSMALISEREEIITEVSGGDPIRSDGTTQGNVTYIDRSKDTITYSSENAGEEYPVRSTVTTTNSDGKPLENFAAKATTAKGNLTFPFPAKGGWVGSVVDPDDIVYIAEEPDESYLIGVDKSLGPDGIREKYKFLSVYRYCQNINLGLKKRPAVDIGLTKKLENAKVVVKEKLYEYKYSGAYDLTEEKQDSLAKYICDGGDTAEVNYQLGLYKSDYYYRAELYQKGDNELYNKLTGFYQKVFNNSKDYTDSEMDIYLTYNIVVANNSTIYNARINRIDDYYDTSLELITENEQKYLKTKTTKADGEQPVNGVEIVAEPSHMGDNSEKVIWKNVEANIQTNDKDTSGSNGNSSISYNKMTAENLNILLGPNDKKEIKVTFKVRKGDSATAKNAIKLGQKCNVAEIASYSTFFADANNCYCKKYGLPDGNTCQHYAGKIDRDSAPGNVDIKSHNEKKWYEDDTFAAPRIEVYLLDEQRTINGLAWEDESKDGNTGKIEEPGYNQKVGDGVKQDTEKEIENLTTELVEKVMIQDENGSYTEYDFIWPTGTTLGQLNNKTIENISGFDSTIVTGDGGTYTFNNVPAGDYVVRFTYGDKEIKSANYSEAYYYNGQDYKSTKYKANVEGSATTEVKPSAYLNLAQHLNSAATERHNSAADSEVRRLEVVNNSREITYENNKILAAAMSDDKLKNVNGYSDDEITEINSNTGARKELLAENGKYYMYADTPKINMNIEYTPKGIEGIGNTNQTQYYDIKNVDFGLEERPATQLTLDKQIEEIILITSDGNRIMDAKYKIDYEVKDDGKIIANVNLDTANSFGTDNLQALNRDQATNHGFRYINVDSNILEGTTITVKYRFTVLNTGEVDRTGRLADIEYTDTGIQQLAEEMKTLNEKLRTYSKEGNELKNNTLLGRYVGNIYYLGENGKDLTTFKYSEDAMGTGTGDKDAVVKTMVRQLVDYIDNDVTFNGTLNDSPNTSWSTITVDELKNKIKPSIIESGTIVDSKGIQYQTENRNNLTVSVDSYGIEASSVNNKDFIIELVPTQALVSENVATAVSGGKDQAFMNLTVTRYVGTDSGDLQIDNIAEIIKYNNEVGRRDTLTIAGNQSPKLALEKVGSGDYVSDGMKYERDTSATEVITLSPPTGTPWIKWRLQVIGSITAGLAIVAGGIIFIKKKILK